MLALVNRAPTKTAYTLEVRIYSTHVHLGSMLHPLFQQAGQGGLLLYRNPDFDGVIFYVRNCSAAASESGDPGGVES